MSIEASLYVSSSAWSRAVSSRPHSLVSLQPHGGKAVDGWADPLVGSSSLSVTGSLHRGKAIVGEVDPLVGSSLPLLSIKGSSHTNIFKTTLIQAGWVLLGLEGAGTAARAPELGGGTKRSIPCKRKSGDVCACVIWIETDDVSWGN
ncbi:hypothetical protein LWI29_007799 [Acer saccharum]|uniref:Uncharacterized protein n=1 Tax=Acer saccharum TaxID=4024 RepID=A0AA39S815_ACESA|nr:hypothetical protein LWI29_007799 [Acer saccharum]